MISFLKIGNWGRLGNQLFQFASTYGIAKYNNFDVYFPKENIEVGSTEDFKDGVTRHVTFDIPKIFDFSDSILKPKKEIEQSMKYEKQEFSFNFNSKEFLIEDNTNLQGYFQTEKYFRHVESDIRELLTFKKEIKQQCATKLFPVTEYTDVEFVGIHLRAGDYVGLQDFHPVLDAQYYMRALNYFTDHDYYFLIFSDDLKYARDIFGNQENIIYMEDNDQAHDLCLLSMCDHNIIANSSFSWWAAWLNQNPMKKKISIMQIQ